MRTPLFYFVTLLVTLGMHGMLEEKPYVVKSSAEPQRLLVSSYLVVM